MSRVVSWISALRWRRKSSPPRRSSSPAPQTPPPVNKMQHPHMLPPVPPSQTLTADIDGITFAYELPHRCLLQQLPLEIAELIFTYALNTYPTTHGLLLLTSKHVHRIVTSTADSLALRKAQCKDRCATNFFSPALGEDLLRSWYRRLYHSVEAISAIIIDSMGLCAKHLLSISEMVGACKILRLGLYLIESLRFSDPHNAARISVGLKRLPAYGILLIRLTSIVLTMMLSHEARGDLWYYDQYASRVHTPHGQQMVILTAERDFEIFAYGVENQLLKHGLEWFAKSMFLLEFGNKTPCIRLDARAIALERVRKGVGFVCWCRQNEGVLRQKRKDEIVSERLSSSYGDLEMAIGTGSQWEASRVMQKVEEEIAGRDEQEVLMEMKMASGL